MWHEMLLSGRLSWRPLSFENAVLACFDNQWPNFLTQTVALGFAFGGQSQLLSNPMLLNGPYGGRPAAVQMTKPHMIATVAQSTMESLLM
jgi:hypothetical protein